MRLLRSKHAWSRLLNTTHGCISGCMYCGCASTTGTETVSQHQPTHSDAVHTPPHGPTGTKEQTQGQLDGSAAPNPLYPPQARQRRGVGGVFCVWVSVWPPGWPLAAGCRLLQYPYNIVLASAAVPVHREQRLLQRFPVSSLGSQSELNLG